MIKQYTKAGSAIVFKNAFIELHKLYLSKEILKGAQAKLWDKRIIKEEQFIWINSIYKTMDDKSIKTLECIAKGKGIYGLGVPKSIRFKGDLAKAEARYNYALEVLYPYCQHR